MYDYNNMMVTGQWPGNCLLWSGRGSQLITRLTIMTAAGHFRSEVIPESETTVIDVSILRLDRAILAHLTDSPWFYDLFLSAMIDKYPPGRSTIINPV